MTVVFHTKIVLKYNTIVLICPWLETVRLKLYLARPSKLLWFCPAVLSVLYASIVMFIPPKYDPGGVENWSIIPSVSLPFH